MQTAKPNLYISTVCHDRLYRPPLWWALVHPAWPCIRVRHVSAPDYRGCNDRPRFQFSPARVKISLPIRAYNTYNMCDCSTLYDHLHTLHRKNSDSIELSFPIVQIKQGWEEYVAQDKVNYCWLQRSKTYQRQFKVKNLYCTHNHVMYVSTFINIYCRIG